MKEYTNQPKFTPGPWCISGCRILSEDGREVCDFSWGENIKDGDLIAAAPDLYDIAFQLVCIGDGMDPSTLPDIINDARAALDKIGAEPEAI